LPSSLQAAIGDTYHVTVSALKLAEGESCPIGRTGRLNFDEGPLEIACAAKVSALP
jgi:hypothetical protein